MTNYCLIFKLAIFQGDMYTTAHSSLIKCLYIYFRVSYYIVRSVVLLLLADET